jgi:hypothetical protein
VDSTLIGIVVFVCTFGGAVAAMALRAYLPDHHLSDETKDTVKLGIGLIATMTALILGLVTASAKSSFDDLNTRIRHTGADILALNRTLERYGPETDGIRASLKAAVAERVDAIWSPDRPTPDDLQPKGSERKAEQVADRIRALTPQTADQRWLQTRALEIGERVLEARWLIFANHGPSVPAVFLGTIVFWLTITFASFGLFAPRNGMAVAVMFVCALSVSGAVFLILELDGSFRGVIQVSPAPLRYALTHLG